MDTVEELGPEPVNITKRIRINHEYGINTFASYAGVVPQTVLRTDQGTYRQIPENVLISLMHLEPDTKPSEFQDHYREFVLEHRRWSQKRKPLSNNWRTYRFQSHPLVYLRKKSGYQSRMGFCTAFCLHPSTIRRYEMGDTESIPEQLSEMFEDIGVLNADVKIFETRVAEWRSHTNGASPVAV